jgi:hypothetical protein
MFCSAGNQALAHNGATSEYTLGEVVAGAPREGAEAVQTEHSVTAEEIRELGARTLDEAIGFVPGVSVRAGPDGVPPIASAGRLRPNQRLLTQAINIAKPCAPGAFSHWCTLDVNFHAMPFQEAFLNYFGQSMLL